MTGRTRARALAAPVGRAAVVVVVAAVGYWQVIPLARYLPGRLSGLTVGVTGLPGFNAKPINAQVVPAGSNPFALVQAAVKRSPHQSGAYSIGWAGIHSQSDVAAMLANLLPTVTGARAVQSQAVSQFLAKKAFAAQSLTYVSGGSVASVPGARQSTFHAPASAATPTSPASPAVTLSLSVFRVGRVVALVSLQTTAADQSALSTITAGEYHHLLAVEPGFSLTETTHPALASGLYGLGALAAAVAAALLPVWVRRARAERRRRQAEAAANLLRIGGSTVVKRQRTTRS